jgi:TonB family protein
MDGSSPKPAASKRSRGLPSPGLFVGLFASACLSIPVMPCLATAAENVPARASADRSGDLAVTEGMTLHVSADLGSVRIETLPPGASPSIHYTVHVETDVPDPVGQRLLGNYSITTRETVDSVFLTGALPDARAVMMNRRYPVVRNAQYWVQFTITVPASFNLDISTGVGDIETGDVGGRVVLVTQGGSITTGRIGLPGHPLSRTEGPAAKISTDGGHITLKDVDGDVDAFTAGGHIIAGNIDGNAKLRTGGGHIRAARIKGTAQLDTEGGNITVGEAGSYVAVRTGGGQIDFGEARGSVHAQTGGGGIRLMYVAGPMEVVTSGGSICLTRVANTVHAQTNEGTITAFITPDASQQNQTVRLPGPSQLASRTGDIVVFVPRNIAMTLDATVDSGGPGRIEADPTLPLNIQTRPEGPVRAVATLNGGGAPLRLHTTTGKIRLQYLDAQLSFRQSLLDEERQRLAEKLNEYTVTQVSMPVLPALGSSPVPMQPTDLGGDWFDNAKSRLQVIFMGSLHQDEKDFKRHLTSKPLPEYPALARKAGIQGLVVLQVRMKTDGSMIVEKVLQGEPSLADAATAAVKNWRASPEQVEGKTVEVVSTVSFNFTLH